MFDCIRENKLVLFKTTKGNFQVKLNAENYPVTVTNFLKNIKNNIYKNKRFYKIINYSQVRIIHSGIHQEKSPISNEKLTSIPLEIGLKKRFEPKYNYPVKDPSEIEDIKNIFQRGSISMVKRGERNSSSTEFFFVTNKIPELDGRYSIFGKIVKGIDVLDKIDKKDFIYEIKISN